MKKQLFIFLLLITVYQISYSQNVGIGTTNPTRAKLEVHGAVGATSAIFGGESSGVSLQRNWPGIGFNTYHGNGSHRYLTNGHGSVFSLDVTNGFMVLDMFGPGAAAGNITFPNRAMVISKEGWVGIGSPQAPTASLHVARGVSFDGTAMLQGTKHHSYFNKGTDEPTFIRAGLDNGIVHINDIPGGKINLYGKIGINTTATDFPLEIKQTLFDKGIQFKILSSTWDMGIDNLGGLAFHSNGVLIGAFSPTTGQYFAISDKRLKTNIHSLPSVLPKLMQLTPVDYQMINAKNIDRKNIGLIAQEVAAIFPELITIVSDSSHGYKDITELHTLDYSGLSVIAIKAIQEQQKLIEILQARIAILEMKINPEAAEKPGR